MVRFALEGLIEYVIASAEEEAAWLRENVEFVVLPFLDKDGVEAGDQGKNRRPRDHNRDYGPESLYPETAAVKALLAGTSEVPLAVALDLHCPWLLGGLNERIYLVGSQDEAIWKEQQKFAALLERARSGALPFFAADSLPFGQDWNVAKNFEKGISFASWAGGIPGIHLASTIEIPYASAHGAEVNEASARAFGADLARALARYIRLQPDSGG